MPLLIERGQGEHTQPDREDIRDGAALASHDVLPVAVARDLEVDPDGLSLPGELGFELDRLVEDLLKCHRELRLNHAHELLEERLTEILQGRAHPLKQRDSRRTLGQPRRGLSLLTSQLLVKGLKPDEAGAGFGRGARNHRSSVGSSERVAS